MGACTEKQVYKMEEKEQLEVLNNIKASLCELERFIHSIKTEDVHFRMSRYIFLINALKEISPYIKVMEVSGRQCDSDVSLLFDEVFKAVKENDRVCYGKAMGGLKEYFKQGQVK